MNKLIELLKRGWTKKAIIFRKNLPTTTDWAKRKNDYTYMLKTAKKNIPSPPSNDFVHIIGGVATIFLFSPRPGVYTYTDMPTIDINDTDDELKVTYKVKRHVTMKKPVKVTQVPGQKEPSVEFELKETTKAVEESITLKDTDKKMPETISFSMEMFDHDDRNFQIRDIEDTRGKYGEKQPWWKEHIASLMVFAGFLLISIGIWLVWTKVTFPSLDVLGSTINCIFPDGVNSTIATVI